MRAAAAGTFATPREQVHRAMKLKARAQAVADKLDAAAASYGGEGYAAPPDAAFAFPADAKTRVVTFKKFVAAAKTTIVEAQRSRTVTEETLRFDDHAARLTALAGKRAARGRRLLSFLRCGAAATTSIFTSPPLAATWIFSGSRVAARDG